MERVNELTKVFLKEFYEKFVINKYNTNWKNRKISFAMLMIIVITIAYLSNKCISLFVSVGEPILFLKLYLLVLTIILIFETILISGNIYYLSKDIEYLIPYPIKNYQLFLAKYNVVLFFIYLTEIVIGGISLIIYGTKFFISIKYYISMCIVLIIFPILFVTIISIVNICLMYFSKFFNNRKIYQMVITILMIIIMGFFENSIFNQLVINTEGLEETGSQLVNIEDNLNRVNEKFLINLSIIQILDKDTNLSTDIKCLLKIIGYNVFFGLILLLVSEKIYINSVLNFFETKKKKSKNKKVKIKKINNERIAYLKKEFKILFRKPNFFMQTIMPLIIILITAIIIVVSIIPTIDRLMENDNNIMEFFTEIPFNIESYCFILIIIQLLYSLSNLSITAISREGKDTIFMKYIPISLYKQFKYKALLQIIVNFIVSLVILSIVYYLIPQIGIVNIMIIFVISLIMNYINSYLMLLVDLIRPNLYWNTEVSVIKNSNNKSFQYGLMIINVLFIMYLGKILNQVNIKSAITIEAIIFAIIFIILNIIIKKYCEKIFRNIN